MEKQKTNQNQNLPSQNMHCGHRARMRQRLSNGDLDSYQTHEIVEMMLYQAHKTKDTNALAHALLNKFGSITGIINADVSELMTIKGIGENTASMIKNYLAVFRRYKMEMMQNKKRLANFNEVFNYAATLLEESTREELIVVCLDGRHEIVNVKTWLGSVNRINILIREIVGFCFASNAVGVIIAHSHPGCLAKPSNNDLNFTRLLLASLRSIDVSLMEHLIIGKDEFFSFHRQGLLEDYANTYYKTFGITDVAQNLLKIQD